ncbi:Ppx/GppA phosphatase family protein [Gorillibacterium timonense]|uniref:Ppx/GppA phosphatase family protein n=1 Tax=Gorillibacterium timonense TaxID=1689269 RepID=UPI00071CE503|nr:Ppx/GppA phosphatase family protein [Gorillibacterium timonense]
MTQTRLFGIIDIGSNSVRLVLYEDAGHGIHRIVEESKKTIRLISKVARDGSLPLDQLDELIATLLHFRSLCEAYRADFIRSVATAAIRNATNSHEVVDALHEATGLVIEIASDEDEARYGFIGVMNAMDISDGFLIDIGGGSSEITLFRDRKIIHSVSFPFGAVNTAKRFTPNGVTDETSLRDIRVMAETLFEQQPWLRQHPGLPLIGLGGTIRTLAKLTQKRSGYSLPLTHNYRIPLITVHETIDLLGSMTLAQKLKVDGLNADRADILVPGLVLLQTALMHTGASTCIVSGTGLREGVYYETSCPDQPMTDHVLAHSIQILMHNAGIESTPHVEQVHRLALQLFDGLKAYHRLGSDARNSLYAASKLFRIGAAINYYTYPAHTFYWITHSRLNGLEHREVVLAALIAAHTGKKKSRKAFLAHQDLLTEADLSTAVALGTLLQLASALDSGRQSCVSRIEIVTSDGAPLLRLTCKSAPDAELDAAMKLSDDFRKTWGFPLRFAVKEQQA